MSQNPVKCTLKRNSACKLLVDKVEVVLTIKFKYR